MKKKFNKLIKRIRIFNILLFPFLITAFIFLNIKFEIPKNIPALFLLLIGSLSNLICLVANNWKMPVYYGKNDYIHKMYKNRKNVRLWFLSDFIHLFIPIFKSKQWANFAVSLGDILLAFGFVALTLNLF